LPASFPARGKNIVIIGTVFLLFIIAALLETLLVGLLNQIGSRLFAAQCVNAVIDSNLPLVEQ